ncbi:hypothetical protein RJD24_05380 [Bacillaceae bacterium IKA-2]|nr:hypothetical protein RJD24_05380 [Bacillaceae bacterium IKA-2]
MFKGIFEFKTVLPITKAEAWSFFNDINNLVRITSFPKVSIITHEGTQAGSQTELELNFLLFKKRWILTYLEVEDQQFFVDESNTVPFPFKNWEHTHSFKEHENGAMMIDKVIFEAYVPATIAKIALNQMFKGREKAIKNHFLNLGRD